MSTQARATLLVDVVGEKKLDALNKQLAGIGKNAIKTLDARAFAKDLDKSAKVAERLTTKIATAAEKSAKRIAASSSKIVKANNDPWGWTVGDATHRAMVEKNRAYNRKRAAADAATRASKAAPRDLKMGPWGERRKRTAFDIVQSAAMREQWAKGPWGGG